MSLFVLVVFHMGSCVGIKESMDEEISKELEKKFLLFILF